MTRILDRRTLLAAYLLLLTVLIQGSISRRVGDGNEYLDMADSLSRFHLPAWYAHFWLYSALAVPFVWVVRLVGANPFAAFTGLNVALLGTAFWVASAVMQWPMLLLLFVSPIVWWSDKPHTEVFTFALLAVAFVALGSRGAASYRTASARSSNGDADGQVPTMNPGWAIACLGVAGAQNPPIAALAALAIPFLLVTRRASLRDRRFLVLCLAGFLVAALHPLYYTLRGGTPFPLVVSTHGRMPNVDELTAVIRDTNIGLVVNAPAFVLGVALAAIVVVFRSPGQLFGADLILSVCALAAFLVSFAQTTNINHGGTPGMSRYALWLIALSLPLLRRFDRAVHSGTLRKIAASIAAVSAVWSVVAFHPSWPEDYSKPTWAARWIWTNYPWLDRPVPEVFIERLAGSDVRWWVPAVGPDCRKILLTGRGPGVPAWPIPCMPTVIPPGCTEAGVMCYANRQGTTYRFSRVPPPSLWVYRFDAESVWSSAESVTVAGLLRQMKWWEMRVCDDEVVRGWTGVNYQRNYCAPDRLFVYAKNPQPGASLRMRLPARMSGSFLDAATGEELQKVAYGGAPGDLWELAVPDTRPSLVLMLTQTP